MWESMVGLGVDWQRGRLTVLVVLLPEEVACLICIKALVYRSDCRILVHTTGLRLGFLLMAIDFHFWFCSFWAEYSTFSVRIILNLLEIGVGQLWGLLKFFVKAQRKLCLWISWIFARRKIFFSSQNFLHFSPSIFWLSSFLPFLSFWLNILCSVSLILVIVSSFVCVCFFCLSLFGLFFLQGSLCWFGTVASQELVISTVTKISVI